MSHDSEWRIHCCRGMGINSWISWICLFSLSINPHNYIYETSTEPQWSSMYYIQTTYNQLRSRIFFSYIQGNEGVIRKNTEDLDLF